MKNQYRVNEQIHCTRREMSDGGAEVMPARKALSWHVSKSLT